MDVLTLAFIYRRFPNNLRKRAGFGMKQCLYLLSLGCKHFNPKREGEDEPIKSDADKKMRHFVRLSID